MPYFDRFDICEAHYLVEVHYNLGGWLHERPSNQRRREATHVQLHRMGFKCRNLPHEEQSLTENGQAIYAALERRYGFANLANDRADYAARGHLYTDPGSDVHDHEARP